MARLVLLLAGFASGRAGAIDVEKLVMPGPVIRGHEKIEAECGKCHAPFKREAQDDLCLDCHREVGEDKQRARGFHGRAPGVAKAHCRDCHSEHEGRDADVVGLDRAAFDHRFTDYPLEGAHARVACEGCHRGQHYENTARDCNGCHRLNDAHLGRFGPKCEQCHTAQGWKPARFDHARDAHFPLKGGHAELSCESCHREGLAQKLSSECVSCHRADDVHRGRRGLECEQCHSEASWKTEGFDHDRRTKFPLVGAHASVRCEACHAGTLGEEKLATRCDGCHRDDDVHRGQQGTRCDDCHNERGWTDRVFFEHDVTRFPLLGMHATVACEQCHATRRFHDVGVECNGCHADDDVHVGRMGGDCARCHNPNGWNLWRFDHDQQTGFALHGAHAELDCHTCHRAPLDSGVTLATRCGGCHAQDDPHRGGFGHACERCHGETSWQDVEVTR